MATPESSSDGDLEPVGTDDSGSGGGRPKQGLLLAGVVVAVGLFFYAMSGDEPGSGGGGGGDTTQSAPDQAGGSDTQLADNDGSDNGGSGSAANLKGVSGDKAVKVLADNVSELQDQLREQRRRDKKQAQRLDELERNVQKQLQSIVETVKTIKQDQARRDYRQGTPDEPDSGASLPQSEELEVEGDDKDEKAASGATDQDAPAFAYKPLYNARQKTRTGQAAQGALSSSPSGGGSSQVSLQTGGGGSGSGSGSGGNADRGESGKAGATSGSDGDAGDDEAEQTEDLVIGAGAMAEAVSLNGADCPIGVSSSGSGGPGGSGGDNFLLRAPVYVQLRGQFSGANDHRVNLGRAMAIGLCQGVRNGERAQIKIERLQYNVDGEKRHVSDIQATVIDNDPNDQSVGVQGTLVSDKAPSAIKASLLEAIRVAGEVGVRSEFTEQSSATSGTTSSALTGSPKAALASGFTSGLSDRLVDLYVNQLESNYDVVHIPAGERLLVVLNQPVTIEDVPSGESSNDDTATLAEPY